MTKKMTSTSNVPNSNNNNNNSGNIQQNSQTINTPPKMKNTHKNHSQYQNQSNSNGIINSKHLHNQSYQQIPKKQKESTVNDGNNENVLMKKLFEAVQKQKENATSGGEVKRTRKSTAPLPKTLNSSENYAGAAFDRAPAAASFPIPSFLKTRNSETGSCSPALSTSCPLPGFNETAKDNSSSSHLKSLSITDLFQSRPTDAETKSEKSDKSENKKLESLTNDLRRILNLR
jgi:hypothetical protein